MDEEMTAKAFRRFVRRRGLIPADEEEQRQASAQQSWSQRASSSQMFPLPAAPVLQPPYSHEMATTTPPASADQHARMQRTQRNHETAQPTRTPRRRRNETDDSARTYKCEFCNLAFGRKHHKERHVANIHRNEKPYVCSICGHPFHQKPNLDRHRSTVHSELSPFQCEFCGLSFSRRSVLKTHLVTVHQRHRRYQCPLCRRFFAQTTHLTDHMKKVHPQSPLPPQSSGSAFPNR